MELNNLIFPIPRFDFNKVDLFEDLIYIPSGKGKEKNYIPCFLLANDISNSSKNFVIFFHGNTEDIFLSRMMAEVLLQTLNMNIVIVEYPGYSIYKGSPTAEKILENTTIVYDFIKKTFDLEDKNIFIFGRSIGSSPAIYLASVRSPNGLLLVSSFTTIRAVANNLVSILSYLLRNRFLSEEYIKNVKCPTYFIHGKSDPLIPYQETEKLYKLCKSKKDIHLPPHMTHNDFDLEEDIMKPIGKFVKEKCKVDEENNDFYRHKEEIEKLYKMPKSIKDFINEKLK